MFGKCLVTVRSKKCNKVVLLTDLVSTSFRGKTRLIRFNWSVCAAYLVNTADSEPECTTFHTSAVHVITDQEDELECQIQWLLRVQA